MIGYIWYSRTALLPIGKRIKDYKWVYPLKTFKPSADVAKVFFEEGDVLDTEPSDQSFYVNHFTILELV